jgi:hypothetical protein
MRTQLQQPLLGEASWLGALPELLSYVHDKGSEAEPRLIYLRFRARLNRNFRGRRKGEEVIVEGDVAPGWCRELKMRAVQGCWESSVGGLVLGVDN